TSSAELKVGNLAAFSKAKASKNGTLFRYQLGQRLNLPAHSSAELPFSQAPLDARQITLFRDLSTGAARTATLFENTTQRTLPAGTIAFFAKGSFVGESFLPRTKPGMRHFLDYGRDLDLTRVIEEPTSPKVTPKAIYFKNGSLGEHFLRERKIEFTFKNTDSEARRVYVQLDVRKNASITGADALDFAPRTKTAYAIFSVPPLGHAKKTLVIKEGLERFINVFTLPRGQIKVLSQAPTLSNAVHGVFIAVLAKRKAFDSEKEKLRQNRRAEKRIKVTLARLRRHLSALGAKNGTVAAPLVKRILKMEDELEAKHALAQTIKTRKKEIRNETRSLLKKLPKA
ncbi:MAG: hypothetical protein KAI47_02750, partial [Deltaproteobacteria bacterium]|nr:hypothetical protein [Deltaproteobacteria bacterium]